jgi:omega-6 fatty acid desaturase (delta-12 desaturase)
MVFRESDMTKSNTKRESPGCIWPDWYLVLATFSNSDNRKATWQLINTIVPYCGIWYLMIRSIQLGYPYTLTLILALPAAAFMVRLFIIFHDCVHGSFFRQQGANTFFGYFLGVLGTQKRVGATARRHGRLFILQIACCVAVDFQ